jgi:hypothetical protein
MDSAYADIAPNFLNTDESLRAARKIGVQYYNWQSSPSRESGVYRYKQQWGATESLYYYLTWFLVSPEARPKLDLRTLQQGYPLHFIVPYLAAPDFLPGYYRKA